ncbi:hypothetical protein LTR04_003759, partial [Oleoguttula sp. CCFEE 6159]
TYPLQKKYHSPEFLRTLPHLRTRLPYNSLLLRLRSQTIASLTTFFAKHDFVQTHPPIITSSDCEGAGEVFAVVSDVPQTESPNNADGQQPRPRASNHFFRSPKYLTVSSQLHLEALAQSVGKVWTLSPTFRAEKSDTPRHLSEFHMLEAEMCFIEHVDQIMNLVEAMLRYVTTELQASRIGKELLTATEPDEARQTDSVMTPLNLSRRWEGMANGTWPRITYAAAIKKLQDAVSCNKAVFEFEPSFATGLQAEHEKFLAQDVGRGAPVFVTDYPRSQKPFYMAPSSQDDSNNNAAPTVACFDLLVPEICELVGGSMREHRLLHLLDSMRLHGLTKAGTVDETNTDGATSSEVVAGAEDPSGESSLQWYIDLRRYGSVPHGGFGLGFDRLLSYLAGVSNIRDIVTFPRWYGRCDC